MTGQITPHQHITPSRLQGHITCLKSDHSAEVLAAETLRIVLIFRHVLNTEEKESDEFTKYADGLSDAELTNINYIRLNGKVVRLQRKKSVRIRDILAARKKASASESLPQERIDYYQKRISKRYGKGRTPKHYCLLQREMFRQLATAFEQNTGETARMGSNSYFPGYIEMCRNAVSGNLKNIRKLASMYLSNLEQTG